MKIKDILNRLDVIAEAPTSQPQINLANSNQNMDGSQRTPSTAPATAPAAPKQNAGTAAGYKGSAAAQAIAKASGIADVNKIKVGQVLTLPDGTKYPVKPGDTLDKIAAANKGSAAPAAPATDNGLGQNAPGVSSAVADAQGKKGPSNAAELAAAQGKPVPDETADAETGTEPSQATMAAAPEGPTGQDAPSAENEKAKIGLAAGSPALQQQQAAAPNQSPDEIARLQQLGGIPQGQVANPFAPKPPAANPETPSSGQTTQPPAPAANPSAGATPVKTGTGGTLTTRDGKPVTTRSDNEIWWSQQPGNMGKQYPGDAVAQQQYDARQAAGQKNMDALKGVGNKIAGFFGGKKPVAVPAGQSQQPTAPPQQVTMENEELSRIINLIHHR